MKTLILAFSAILAFCFFVPDCYGAYSNQVVQADIDYAAENASCGSFDGLC